MVDPDPPIGQALLFWLLVMVVFWTVIIIVASYVAFKR